ncbi:V-type ATP synthase subunit D [Microbispora sp. NBRC 16548]|uniref:V-type ATP synthase subunit D n=1 Tax=Microbispora sp. NBRC 16548 TaxID=3030994 RepID=UPI0024A0BAA5|nr:V-type ATP synthase subunit D [Microbispora sp. NBRC 16548]GLX03928.1 hypothetical protein Misp03_08550 [Microbispora sp. NBRC 16548]
MTLRVPPGRAGRLWLRHRLAVLRRGLAVLERKLLILRRERERLTLLVERTGAEWEAACRAADVWSLRASLLGGRRAFRLAGCGPLAQEGAEARVEVRIEWADAAGTSYPGRAVVVWPAQDGSAAIPLTAALGPAVDACRTALAAAVAHAAAGEAERIVRAAETETGRRIRALRDHVLPRMEAALAAVELALDDMERADGARVRRAVSFRSSRRPD